MAAFFPPPHTETTKGHGRIETRTIRVSCALNDYLDFPYLRQVFRIERDVTDLDGSNPRSEVVCGLTSLSADIAPPSRILEVNRGHWSIENRLHWVRDVTFDEDRSRIRKGRGAQVMASIRNIVISIFRIAGYIKNIAAALRDCCWNVKRTLRLAGLVPTGLSQAHSEGTARVP